MNQVIMFLFYRVNLILIFDFCVFMLFYFFRVIIYVSQSRLLGGSSKGACGEKRRVHILLTGKHKNAGYVDNVKNGEHNATENRQTNKHKPFNTYHTNVDFSSLKPLCSRCSNRKK